jgi:hypothetical protein
MSKYTFIFLLVLLAVLALLVWAAFAGSLLAGVVLAVIATAALMLAGAGLALLVLKQANAKQQADFIANARENLAIMTQLQRAQNLQNLGIMSQVRTQGQLTAGGSMPGLTIENDIFDELEQ